MTAPAEAQRGTVLTFYSYKGGTGRTMAMANPGTFHVLMAPFTYASRPGNGSRDCAESAPGRTAISNAAMNRETRGIALVTARSGWG